ncbi:hypothetical protein Dimus_010385 [Dionaea muscipula]
MATGSTREARRRRILEGGSDRLALITGRTPTQSSTSQDLDFSGFSSPFVSENLDFNPSVFHNEEGKPSNYTIPKSDQAEEFNQIDTSVSGSRGELFSRKAETGDISAKAPATEAYARPDPSRVLHGAPHPSLHAQGHSALKINFGDLFTYQQVTTAVAATEQTRMFCSLVMAFLVVLSYMGFPIVSSWVIGSVIQFRPLYLVLLTNITLILQHLISAKQQGLERAGKEAGKSPTTDGYYGWAEEAGKAIEMVFMAQSVSGALFMDCSVYAIIVICGLSVA